MMCALTKQQDGCLSSQVPDRSNRPPPLLLRLQRDPRVNTVVKRLGLHRVADVVLGFRPMVKTTPHGFQYKIRSVASIVAANEIFETSMYEQPLRGADIRRFVDLGCNVGYFPILLAELTGSRELQGLMIDGNAKRARRGDRAHGDERIDSVVGLCGLAGFADDQKEADFLVNPSSHIASTATGKMNPDVPSAGRSVKVTVPCVNVEKEWTNRFGDVPIDLLKIDIEGMELELFRHASGLLARSARLLFEWHKWQVSIADCRAVLSAAGFDEPQTVWEDAQHGLAYACRREVAEFSKQ